MNGFSNRELLVFAIRTAVDRGTWTVINIILFPVGGWLSWDNYLEMRGK